MTIPPDALADVTYIPHLAGSTKRDVIQEMVNFLAQKGCLPDPKAALHAVLERERRMSTGMQSGVAIPHGKTVSVTRTVVAVALKKEGIDFQSMDGQPARIFVMTLSPVKEMETHIHMLSVLGTLLTRSDVRERLLACSTEEEMKRTLAEALAAQQ